MTRRAEFRFPRPFSLNNKDVNTARGRAKSAAYKAWIAEAQSMIMAQGLRPRFAGPVRVDIEIGEAGVSPLMDGDNAIKPILDVLVSMGIIPDDNRRIVVGGSWEWVPGLSGCKVRIIGEDVR